MGGKNHQPCRDYLTESTKLSRSMSLAHSSLELANVALEDILLAELAGGKGAFDPFAHHLSVSLDRLGEAAEDVVSLRRKMEERHFADLPSRDAIDFDALGAKFAARGVVADAAWRQVIERLKEGGFRAVLTEIEARLAVLAELTRTLTEGVASLRGAVAAGEANVVLEENQPGSIKFAFARLYTAWAQFEQYFLASSMASTEQWYVFMGYGSLLGEPTLLPQSSPQPAALI
jgi:hypothetical protein